MATSILNKKNFLEWIARQIEDDQIIIMTPHIVKAEVKKRTNEKRIEYSFAADSFKKADSVNDIYSGSMLNCAIVIADREDVDEETLKMIKP